MQEYIKKILGSGNNNLILIISNDEMKDILRLLNFSRIQAYYLKESVKQLKMKLKNKKEDFLVCY